MIEYKERSSVKQTVTNKVTGEQITFIETAKDTNGEYLLIKVALPPRGKVDPYISMITSKRI